ncbi:MAG TPA: hypothetical protein VFC09_07520 [Candidatus Dormibacteraeota bacterium]|nr:hypothetical protein [Candidatus Dormibacteraeota bacterium]
MSNFLSIPTPDGDMLAHPSVPDGERPFPVVILLQEAFGVTELRCPGLFCFGLEDPTIPPHDIETLRWLYNATSPAAAGAAR